MVILFKLYLFHIYLSRSVIFTDFLYWICYLFSMYQFWTLQSFKILLMWDVQISHAKRIKTLGFWKTLTLQQEMSKKIAWIRVSYQLIASFKNVYSILNSLLSCKKIKEKLSAFQEYASIAFQQFQLEKLICIVPTVWIIGYSINFVWFSRAVRRL